MIKCNECGEENNWYIDEQRKALWCNGCGNMEQYNTRSYDWEEDETD